MIVVGLTGSIGMGKSVLARQLRSLKIPVHSSDEAVHKLLGPNGAAVKKVGARFPRAKKGNAIDRKILGALIFGDDAARRDLEKILHPLVRTNPYNGRKALYLGGEAGSTIDGLPDDEGEALFAELLAWLTQPRFRYVHHWAVGDIVMSDQRGSIHRATEWDEVGQRRLIHRATVFDDHRPY